MRALFLNNNQKEKVMAKNYGIFGRTSGKVGNVVFTNTSDGQIASAYNPNKPKERSQAQIDSSAKFAFMKKVSALFPPELLLGLGGNDKENRRKFDSMILRNVVWEGEGVERHPALEASRIVLAEGELKYPWELIYNIRSSYYMIGEKDYVDISLEVEPLFEPFILGNIVLGLSNDPDCPPILFHGVVSDELGGYELPFIFRYNLPTYMFFNRYKWFTWLIRFKYDEELKNQYTIKEKTQYLKNYNISMWKKLFALENSDSIFFLL